MSTTISDGINQITQIINAKSSPTEKQAKIEPILQCIVNYDKFFSHVAGADLWTSLSTDEKKKIIDGNNRLFIQQYLPYINECSAFSIAEVGDPTKQKRNFVFTCNDIRRGLDIIALNGKILDIQISGISFIQIEKQRLMAFSDDLEKKKALLISR